MVALGGMAVSYERGTPVLNECVGPGKAQTPVLSTSGLLSSYTSILGDIRLWVGIP
jgi:hypothetical protein